MSDTNLYESVIELKSDVKEILRRLQIQNGSIAAIIAEQTAMKLQQVRVGPLVEKVEAMRADIDRGQLPLSQIGAKRLDEQDDKIMSIQQSVAGLVISKEQSTDTWREMWREYLRPLIIAPLVMAIFVLLLSHADLFVRSGSSTTTATQTSSHTETGK